MNDFASRFKNNVRANFDLSKHQYMRLEEKHDFYGKLTDSLLNFIGGTGFVQPGWNQQQLNILDVGCGIGNSTKRLQERFPKASLAGLDLSPKMLDAAKEQCLGVNFVCGDGENLLEYFPAGSFDLVIYPASLFILPQQEQSLEQARELLKDGGIVAASIIRELRGKGGAQINALAGLPGIVKNEKLLGCLSSLFSQVSSTSVQIPIGQEVAKDIYAIPALLAGLFPKLPPPDRLLKLNELIAEVSTRNLELVQEWTLIAAKK